jgi:sensor domain CHASE-containing protein
MNIKWKFAVLTIAVCGISMLSSVSLWFFQKNEATVSAKQKGEDAAARIEKLLILKSGYYRKQANDYSHWNDLVKYVGTKDACWAKDNLDGSLDEFGSNGIYVINTDKPSYTP